GQVIGVYDHKFVTTIAEALALLDVPKAIVLHGREKLDEAGLGDGTDLALLLDGKVSISSIHPQALGLKEAAIADLKGGGVEENATILRNVLQGKGTQAQQEAVILNASLALQVGEAVSFGKNLDGIAKAREIINSGAAWLKLEELVRFLQS
ncbi:MAG: anthranilate phosphoribosyltransferase, partial [Xenococcaceae cyanobacterium]